MDFLPEIFLHQSVAGFDDEVDGVEVLRFIVIYHLLLTKFELNELMQDDQLLNF